MVLLHGFLKKTRRTPAQDLSLARGNKKKHERGCREEEWEKDRLRP
jgi:phage-related protein